MTFLTPFQVEGFDLSSVKACTSGGAPLGSSIIREVYNRLGCLVKMGYGLSETSGVTGQIAQTWDELESVLGSTGVAFQGVELRIISVDTAKSERGSSCHDAWDFADFVSSQLFRSESKAKF